MQKKMVGFVLSAVVDRTLTPINVLRDTGRLPYASKAFESMPDGTGIHVEVEFFEVHKKMCPEEVGIACAERGLFYADPRSLAAVNKANPGLARYQSNVTLWQDHDGKWCSIHFEEHVIATVPLERTQQSVHVNFVEHNLAALPGYLIAGMRH
ncbi:MAG: hypothetical protein WCW14_00165 [Candidatus Paceibacterota bacterium]|jgi:hypothetical protein